MRKPKKVAYIIGLILLLALIGGGLSQNSFIKGAFMNRFSPIAPLNPLKSNLFKNDPQAQRVLNKKALDLNEQGLYIIPNQDYVHSLPYKIYVGLVMVGHQTDPGKNSTFMISLINRFQQNNNLPLSSQFTKDALLKLDLQVAKKEREIANYSTKTTGTIFQSITPNIQQRNIPIDYITWIFNFPFTILPKDLIADFTPNNYFICIYQQCVGSLQKPDGSQFTYSEVTSQRYLQGNFIFTPDIFPATSTFPSSHPAKSLFQVAVILHEFAHFIDGPHPPSTNFSVDTRQFKDISFNMTQLAPNDASCARRWSNDVRNFITRYPLNGYPSLACQSYGPEYGAPNEDFAESFTAYVLAGKIFRRAAQQNRDLYKKYEWLKKNVFFGTEYDTELPYGVAYAIEGCVDAPDSDANGGPHYISCNNNFVWDGKIPIK